MSVLTIAVLAFGALAVVFFSGAVRAFGRRRVLGSLAGFLIGSLLLALALLAGTISVATQGYRALTHEEVAAQVRTEPVGRQRFRATVRLADGSLHMFELAGDALYVDAHILKWHPVANLLGLHTAYELDRVAGRYDALSEEQSRPRTVYALARDKPLDMFHLARRYRLLRPLVDAEYGSATFIATKRPAEFEVRVSTTGLLVRPVDAATRGPPP